MSTQPPVAPLPPLVARMHPTDTRSRRLVLVAKVTDDIPAGSFVALVDIRGELFLRVLEHDNPALLTAQQVKARAPR